MPEKMDNPYEKFGAHRCEVRVGHGLSWWFAFLFLIVCTLAPFWRNTHQFFRGPNGWTPVLEIFDFSRVGDETLFEHLRGAEKRIENADFTGPPRKGLQRMGTAIFREGNRKTAIGRDGWLYYRPAIDAMTGYGPLKPEPKTVAKDPNRKPWRGPLDAILEFDRQLDEFGVELILVPIPVKPMIYPEHLTGRESEEPITHPDAERFFEKLREGGVDVLDLSEPLFERRGDGVFLKQDTHWTPAGLDQCAGLVADDLRRRPWFAELDRTESELAVPREVAAAGDLVENLELEKTGLFGKEAATIAPVNGAKIYDQASPVVLLGDSFTNIFHQEAMNWGEQAGFAQHLSRKLGISLDTIARNGQASTGVRRSLALRPFADRQMREKKKAVVWAIAARDLFLSESVARDLGVEWEDVKFNTDDPAAGIEWPVVIEATVSFASDIPDPKTVNYKDSLYAVDYEDIKVIEGDYRLDGAQVFYWAFEDKQMKPTAYFQEGERHRLKLDPFSEQPSNLQSLQIANNSKIFDFPPAWAIEKVDVLSGGKRSGESRSEQSAARIASIATAVFALLMGAVLLTIFRRKSALRASR